MAGSAAGVFINCPYDDAYQKCHNAIVLCVVACGLEPRSAMESGTVSSPRMKRISTALRASSYSIHDLTRALGDPKSASLTRYNMPFEFGMAFFYSESTEDGLDHDWLALLPSSHPYGEFISDLSGYDLETHNGTPESLVPPTLAWLSTRPDMDPLPPTVNPNALIELLPELEVQLVAARLAWGKHLSWKNYVKIIRDLAASRL